MKLLRLLAFAFMISLPFAAPVAGAASADDAEFEKVAEEYIKGWLAAHPLAASALGLHEFDGRINDYTRLSIDAELSRLRRFDERLKKFDAATLSAHTSVDLRILQAAIAADLFSAVDMAAFEITR